MPKGIYNRNKSKWYPPTKGKHLSLETRNKISQRTMGRIPWNKDKKMSKEFCQKNREAQKGIQAGEKNPRWNGGICHSCGYIFLFNPRHPFAINNKRYVKKARLIMEKHLRRYLNPTEVIHHINGIKTDDRISNLKLFANQTEHSKFHHQERKRDDNCRYTSTI